MSSHIHLNSRAGHDHSTDHGNSRDLFSELVSGQLNSLNHLGGYGGYGRSLPGPSLDSLAFHQLLHPNVSRHQSNLDNLLQELNETFHAAQRNQRHQAGWPGSNGFRKLSDKELVEQFFAKGKAFMTEDGHYSMKKVQEWAEKKNPRNAEERNLQKLASEFMSAKRGDIRHEINHGNSPEHIANQLFENKNLQHAYKHVSNKRPDPHDHDHTAQGKERRQLLTQVKDYWKELSAFGRTANDRPGRMKADAIADIAAGRGAASPGLKKLAERIMNMPGMNSGLVDGAGWDSELSQQELEALIRQQGHQSGPGHSHPPYHLHHHSDDNSFV